MTTSIAVISGLWLVVELVSGHLGGATMAFATLLLVVAAALGEARK